MTFNLPSSWSLIKQTRTRTSGAPAEYHDTTGGEGGILPGGGWYGSKKNHRGHRRKRAAPSSSMAGQWWSPYARPPRRSKRLVVLWLGAFLVAGLVTWWISTRHRGLARSYADVLVHQPQQVPVVDE